MEKRKRVLKLTFLIAAFAVTAGFAVQGHVRARRCERLLTNTYYHAFTELTTAAGELDAALQKTAYATQGPLRDSLYQQIYAKALAAQYALGELPYGNVELERTAAFFAKTGDYAAALCRGTCDGSAENLAALSDISRKLNASLGDLQAQLEAGGLDLTRADRAAEALSQTAEAGERELGGTVFQDVESDFPELPSLVYDGPFSEHLSSETPQALAGLGAVTQEEARQAAADFLHADPEALTLTSAGEGVLPTYAFTIPQDGGAGYIEVTRQGGKTLEYFRDRAPGPAVMTADQGVELARNYLANWGYAQMEPSYHLQREGVLTVHFAPIMEGVYCYPDLVKVTVALDDGALLGYEAHGYLYRHRLRDLSAPAVSQDYALAALPDGLAILSSQLALIPTQGGTREVLTYEFKCQAQDGGHALIYVNAQTGLQENILLLLEDESGTLAL